MSSTPARRCGLAARIFLAQARYRDPVFTCFRSALRCNERVVGETPAVTRRQWDAIMGSSWEIIVVDASNSSAYRIVEAKAFSARLSLAGAIRTDEAQQSPDPRGCQNSSRQAHCVLRYLRTYLESHVLKFNLLA